jgi:hypothetical protein
LEDQGDEHQAGGFELRRGGLVYFIEEKSMS